MITPFLGHLNQSNADEHQHHAQCLSRHHLLLDGPPPTELLNQNRADDLADQTHHNR